MLKKQNDEMNKNFKIRHASGPAIVPQSGCDWAEKMVLNPAIIADDETERLHMLFRASGPYPQKRLPGKDLPYPIFLGYAYSDDNGESWTADFSRPALAPALEYEREKLFRLDGRGRPCLNYANAYTEDPRLFYLEGELYLTVACRVFPVGAYWNCRKPGDEPDVMPDWHATAHDLGRAVTEDVTVTVLYHVDLQALKRRDYDHAFKFLTRITDPERGDNRDAFLFPERLTIDGRKQYVMLHRCAESFDGAAPHHSMWMSAADDLYDLGTAKANHRLLAVPTFNWEQDRIGGSWPPIKLADGQWLLAYHGKQDNQVGYTQSFMILKQGQGGWPEIHHRCSERLLYTTETWEFSDLLYCPCIFTCSGILRNGELIMGYGAADEKVGIARCDFTTLVDHVKDFDKYGIVKHIPTNHLSQGDKRYEIMQPVNP